MSDCRSRIVPVLPLVLVTSVFLYSQHLAFQLSGRGSMLSTTHLDPDRHRLE